MTNTRQLIADLTALVDLMMPGVAKIVFSEFALLNETLIAARAYLREPEAAAEKVNWPKEQCPVTGAVYDTHPADLGITPGQFGEEQTRLYRNRLREICKAWPADESIGVNNEELVSLLDDAEDLKDQVIEQRNGEISRLKACPVWAATRYTIEAGDGPGIYPREDPEGEWCKAADVLYDPKPDEVLQVVAWKANNGQWAASERDAKEYERRMAVTMHPLCRLTDALALIKDSDQPRGQQTLLALKALGEVEIAQRDARIAEFEAQAGDGTSSNKYRAELYDEVWQTARDMGYGNVIGALQELATLKAQPSAGVVLPERMVWDGLRATACNIRGDAWNDCLDEVARLNPCRTQSVAADHSAQTLNMVPDGLQSEIERAAKFVEVVRECERLASSFCGSIDGVDEHGGDDHEDPTCAIWHRLYYAMFDGDKVIAELRRLAAAPSAKKESGQ